MIGSNKQLALASLGAIMISTLVQMLTYPLFSKWQSRRTTNLMNGIFTLASAAPAFTLARTLQSDHPLDPEIAYTMAASWTIFGKILGLIFIDLTRATDHGISSMGRRS